jgi:hypothetical protein
MLQIAPRAVAGDHDALGAAVHTRDVTVDIVLSIGYAVLDGQEHAVGAAVVGERSVADEAGLPMWMCTTARGSPTSHSTWPYKGEHIGEVHDVKPSSTGGSRPRRMSSRRTVGPASTVRRAEQLAVHRCLSQRGRGHTKRSGNRSRLRACRRGARGWGTQRADRASTSSCGPPPGGRRRP